MIYDIKAGDTASEIAKANKTDLTTIQKLNPNITDINKIQAGAKLNLPDSTPQPSPKPIQATSDTTVPKFDQPVIPGPDTKTGATTSSAYRAQHIQNIKTGLTAGTTEPIKPGYVEQYKGLYAEQIAPLETKIVTNKAEQTALLNELKVFKEDVSGKGRTASEVAGMEGSKTKEIQDKLTELQKEETNINTQLSQKNSFVSTIMNLTEKDYSTAVNDYNKTYAQNLQAEQLYNTEQTAEESQAKAYLTTITNSIKSNALDYSKLDDTTKNSIKQAELQAGWPMGTIEQLKATNPKADILYTTDGYDSAGNAITTFVYKDENGMPGMTYVKKTGGMKKSAGDATTKPTHTEELKSDISSMSNQLQSVSGSDGYINPSDYAKAKRAWVTAGNSSKSFDESFSIYRNPSDTYNLD